MKRTVPAALALLLLAAPASAEVSVTHLSGGSVELYFEAGPSGPWGQVRLELPAADLLNGDGDLDGDSWPEILANPASGRPDVIWSSGGNNREVMFSWHDGTVWRAARNLSNSSGNDELPALAADEHGNRFAVWTRRGSSRDQVLFTALSGDDDADQTAVFQLSERHDTARRAVLGVHADGDVYVAYEEAHNGNDPVTYLAIDRVQSARLPSGFLSDSGERPIDIARSSTFATAAAPGSALSPQVHAEGGHLWIDWIDSAGQLGWTELIDGAFTSPGLVSIDEAGSEHAAREQVRTQVLD